MVVLPGSTIDRQQMPANDAPDSGLQKKYGGSLGDLASFYQLGALAPSSQPLACAAVAEIHIIPGTFC